MATMATAVTDNDPHDYAMRRNAVKYTYFLMYLEYNVLPLMNIAHNREGRHKHVPYEFSSSMDCIQSLYSSTMSPHWSANILSLLLCGFDVRQLGIIGCPRVCEFRIALPRPTPHRICIIISTSHVACVPYPIRGKRQCCSLVYLIEYSACWAYGSWHLVAVGPVTSARTFARVLVAVIVASMALRARIVGTKVHLKREKYVRE